MDAGREIARWLADRFSGLDEDTVAEAQAVLLRHCGDLDLSRGEEITRMVAATIATLRRWHELGLEIPEPALRQLAEVERRTVRVLGTGNVPHQLFADDAEPDDATCLAACAALYAGMRWVSEFWPAMFFAPLPPPPPRLMLEVLADTMARRANGRLPGIEPPWYLEDPAGVVAACASLGLRAAWTMITAARRRDVLEHAAEVASLFWRGLLDMWEGKIPGTLAGPMAWATAAIASATVHGAVVGDWSRLAVEFGAYHPTWEPLARFGVSDELMPFVTAHQLAYEISGLCDNEPLALPPIAANLIGGMALKFTIANIWPVDADTVHRELGTATRLMLDAYEQALEEEVAGEPAEGGET